MTNEEKELDMLAPELRQLRTAVPVEDPALVAARRSRMVNALESEIARAATVQSKRRVLRRFAWISAAAAVVALSIGGGVLLNRAVHAPQEATARTAASVTAGSTESASVDSGSSDAGSAPMARVLRFSGQASAGLAGAGPEGLSKPLTSGTQDLTAGNQLSTHADGWVALELPGHSRLEVSGSTTVRLAALTPWNQRLELSNGRIDISIPKDPNGAPHHMVVVTPDSEVEVKGTVFSVVVEPSRIHPDHLVTEVFVARGAVAVRHAGHEELLTLGRRWRSEDEGSGEAATGHLGPAGQPAAASASGSLTSGSLTSGQPAREQATAGLLPAAGAGSSGRAAGSTTGSARGQDVNQALAAATAAEPAEVTTQRSAEQGASASPPAADASTLGAQNRMFERALAARDRGDLTEALRILDDLVQRYPDSPLFTSARSEHARIVARLSKGQDTIRRGD